MAEGLSRAMAASRLRGVSRLELRRSSPKKINAAPAPRSAEDRRKALAAVLPLWPHELEDDSPSARRRIVAKLHSALRAERRRGVSGHWSYDLARHRELLRVYREELAALTRPQREGAGPGEP